MKKAITILVSIILIMGVFTACGNNAKKKTTKETYVTEETSKKDVKSEIDSYWKEKNRLNNEAIKLIKRVDKNDSMDKKLLSELLYKQEEFDLYRNLSRKELSLDAYKELHYDIESDNGFWQPIQYAEQSFYLPAHYFVKAIWEDNVVIDKNNDDWDSERVYKLKDSTKAGYLLLDPLESEKRLVVIMPGSTIEFFN